MTSSVTPNCIGQYPIDSAGALPKKETLAKLVRRQRTFSDSNVLTDELRKSTRGEDLVIHESEGLLILATSKNFDLLASKKH